MDLINNTKGEIIEMELKMINSKLVTVAEIEMIKELDKFRLPIRVFNVYRSFTKGNDFLKFDQVKKKLIRNMVLGVEAPMIVGTEHKKVFQYGNLMIHINLAEGTIAYLQNYDGKFFWDISKEKIHTMNEIMGIEEI